MKKLAKRLAAMIVTYYYNRIYRKAVAYAEKKHRESRGEMFYVVDHLVKGQTLTVVNRKMFRMMKHDAQRWTNPNYAMYYSKDYNISLVKDGCWYRTCDKEGKGGLTHLDAEARRLFFIRVGLMRAKLLDRVIEPKEEEEGNGGR